MNGRVNTQRYVFPSIRKPFTPKHQPRLRHTRQDGCVFEPLYLQVPDRWPSGATWRDCLIWNAALGSPREGFAVLMPGCMEARASLPLLLQPADWPVSVRFFFIRSLIDMRAAHLNSIKTVFL